MLFIFKGKLTEQLQAEFLLRFIDFWVILGFAFFITVWLLQAIHAGLLKKDIQELEGKVTDLKSKLYDLNKIPEGMESKDSKITEPDTINNPGSS
jgi:hypothetical protein